MNSLFCPLDTVSAISEKQKLLEQQRQEIEEIERNSDREVSFGHDQKSISTKCILLI